MSFYIYEIRSLNELLFLVAFIGFGSGAGGILFWSMLPDTIEYGEVKKLELEVNLPCMVL